MLSLFLLLLIIPVSHAWVLESTPTEVHETTTTNVTLLCYHDNINNDTDSTIFKKVARIIIRKCNEGETPVPIAEVVLENNGALLLPTKNSDVRVSGKADRTDNSYLSITWAKASRATFGRYSCEINGYAPDFKLVKDTTKFVSIVRTLPDVSFLVRLVESLRNETNASLASVRNTVKKVQEEIDGLKRQVVSMTNVTRDMDELRRQFVELKNAVERGANETEDKSDKGDEKAISGNGNVTDEWPSGSFALLNTTTGCPGDRRSGWTEGYIRVYSESSKSENLDATSKQIHLAQPTFERNSLQHFVYIRTCKHRNISENSRRPEWPQGSYCIHRVDGVCPMGFKEGTIRMDTEDGHTQSMVKNPPDISYPTNGIEDIELYCCCRNDGSSHSPIDLPLDHPFYLYRYGGTCQNVAGAEISYEWLQINTENSYNRDTYMGNHPDAFKHPYRLFFCYYRKEPSQ